MPGIMALIRPEMLRMPVLIRSLTSSAADEDMIDRINAITMPVTRIMGFEWGVFLDGSQCEFATVSAHAQQTTLPSRFVNYLDATPLTDP